MRSAASSASRSVSSFAVPGSIGTSTLLMASRAETLSPIRRISSGWGPIQCSPHFCTTSAKCGFSARKP
jgi:hypothetical protein